MNYSHSMTGSLNFGGCSLYIFKKFVYVKFKVGSIVYSKPKALKGIIEKIVIKKIRLFPFRDNDLIKVCKICNFPPLYIDTLNAYHNEEDLVGPEEASELADSYLLTKRANLENLQITDC